MGIPAFYRWLTERYPLTIADVMEETPLYISGVSVPVDTSCPNPNGVEFDNLYLDMNGIIHPCFHPEGLPPPTTYEEVFAAVFKYIDRIFSIVRPRKLLFMAIDGVAPRAKMNQQRSRRFRAARDAACQALSIETNGGIVSESKEGNLEQVTKLDSNVITPGTEFMDLLSSALRSYIGLRMKEKLGWRGIKVILSDANVAGEGEHKIMSYIRLQRNLPGFDPNTRHCLYGLDADLIMLALASHEIHFSILREDHGNASTGGKSFKEKQRVMKRQKLNGDSEEIGKFAEKIENHISGMKFQFFNVWILREYLAYDMRIPDTTLKVDLERVIDDFVFMCLFVGNDFLPHIPSLEISEGAIDLLMTVYKKEFARMGGYLTNSFEINLIRVEHFVQAVGSHESAIFRRRNQMQKEWEIRLQRQSKYQKPFHSSKSLFDDGVSESCKSSVKMGTTPLNQNQQNPQSMAIQQSNHFSFNDTSAVVDKIKLGDEGWKERFYAEKFETKSEDERDTIRRHAVFKYVEGICWVMRYYYEGVCSWQWFYPYHYAPFASDFYGCGQLEIHFTLGKPFKPFDQLMAVLPAASAHALPLFYRKLMMDASSPILDFYPIDFELDINGKRFSWQAICKLPFIEESRLVSEIAKVEHTLTDEERRRNRLGYDVLCVRVSHPLAVKVISLLECKDQSALPTANIKYQIDPTISGGMNGYIYISEKPEWLMTTSDQVISVFYEYPPFHSHIPRLPEGVILPNKSVTKWNCLHAHQLWHEPAVSSSVSSKRQIPKSISGPQLAKLAHRLVSEYSSSKHLDVHRCAEHGFPLDADRMGERRTEVQPKKRKRDKCNKDCLDGRSKESQVGKGDFVPINNAENMESSTLRQQGGSSGDYISAGVDEIKVDKSKKRKWSSKDREHKEGAEGAGIPDGVQKLERSIQEQRNSDHTPGGADGENDYKEAKSRESKSRKRKERNKKGNQNDGDSVRNKNAEKLGCTNHISKLQSCILQEQSGGDVHAGGDVALELKTEVKSKKRRKIEADGGVINNVEKLGSCFLMEQRGDSTHTNADGLNATRNPVPNNNYQELEDGALELKTELKSKKRKKFVADGILINNVEKLGGSSLMEQRGGDSNLTNVVGLGATRSPVPNNIDQEFEDSGLREQIEHFDHSGANEVEIKPEIKSKRKKRRSKKKQQIELIVPTNDPLNLQSDLPGKEGALDSNHIGAGGLEMKPEVNSKIIAPTNDPLNLQPGLPGKQGALDSNLIGLGGLEMKAEVKSKRKKRRSKNKRKIELIVPTNDPLNLQSGLPGNQGALDSNHIGAGGLGMKPEVNSKIIVPTNEPLNLLPGLPGKQGAFDSNHIGVGGFEMKAEVKSKRKKRRSKKKQKIELIVPTNDPLNLQSGPPGQQGALDSNHIGVGGLEMKPEVNSKIIVPTNDPLNLQSGLPGNQGGLDSKQIVVGGLEMKPEVNSKIIVPTNDPQNLQSGLPGQQGALDSNLIGVGGLGMKPEVKSKRKKRRSKKKQQTELIVPTNDPLNLKSGLPGIQGALDSNHIGLGGLEMKTEV